MTGRVCWWCGHAAIVEAARLVHRRSGETRTVGLCRTCLTQPDRSWRLAWSPVDDAA
jgi:hypothetical protein